MAKQESRVTRDFDLSQLPTISARHDSEDSVGQRHRKILVFAHVGAKKHEMPPDRHAPSSTKRDSHPS